MAKQHKNRIEKVYLPSYEDDKKEDQAWVDIQVPVRLTDFDSIDSALSQIMQSAHVIASKIKDWNLTDDADQKLEINAANVYDLEALDFTFLSLTLGLDKIMKLTSQKKRI